MLKNLGGWPKTLLLTLVCTGAGIALGGYAVIQVQAEAYDEGARVARSSLLLQEAFDTLGGNPRSGLTKEKQDAVDKSLERAFQAGRQSEAALSWLQMFAHSAGTPEFAARVQAARCEAKKSQPFWFRAPQVIVDVRYGATKYELPPC